MPIRRYWALAAFLGLCSCGPAFSDISKILPPDQEAPVYRLGPGDKIRLSLYGDDSFSGEFNVSNNGNVSLPLIGDQLASGKTIEQFRDLVSARLADGFYRKPSVYAEIIRTRPFYILGEVNDPGGYPFVAGLNLRQAVALAGGYTYRANHRAFDIQKADSSESLRFRSADAVPIQPGDTIIILERYF